MYKLKCPWFINNNSSKLFLNESTVWFGIPINKSVENILMLNELYLIVIRASIN